MSEIKFDWSKNELWELHKVIVCVSEAIRRRNMYKCNRKDLELLEKHINEFIEKWIKTDIRIHCSILDKDDEHLDWCRMKLSRDIDLVTFKK